MVSVILPTRGFVFAEVLEAVEENLKTVPHSFHLSHNLKIPDSDNYLVEEALKENPSHLLFIEEDTVMPDNGFTYLTMAHADIACIDYSVAGWGCVTRNKANEILWCGLGCTLVKKEVFDKLEKPYFRTDKTLLLNDWPIEHWIDVPEKKAYGGHDIWFCLKAREKGFTIVQAEGECRHLRLKEMGREGYNDGLHMIEEKPKISKHQILA